MKNFMKKVIKNIRGMVSAVNNVATKCMIKVETLKANAKLSLSNQCGENYVDSGVKILIAVVLGALLLGGLYALFGDVIMPELSKRIKEMFDYKG